MVKETYGFGSDIACLSREEAGKIASISEAAKKAKDAGLGFIIGYSKPCKRPYRIIYAWDVHIVSAKEAREMFQDSPQKMNIIDDYPTEVFIVSPAGDGQEIIFPFKPFRKLTMVKLSQLLTSE